jgi:nucleotide-binding universal stress UspA family protein
MIKDVIVNLSPAAPKDIAGEFALSVASTCGAHLSGTAFQYRVEVPGTIITASTLTAFLDAQRAESGKASRDAVARFEHAAKGAGVAVSSRILEVALDDAPETFAKLARAYDLAVVRQPNAEVSGPEELYAEGVLFGAGRPLLIVPYIQKSGLKLDRITLCWDGSRSAARAIADALPFLAMPFLARSKAIEVLMVQSREAPADDMTGAEMARHLARHDLKVELSRLTVPDINVAEAILSHTADWGTDLLVMGGYGHSRLREYVLGGVTREIMRSMTVPTLMSH